MFAKLSVLTLHATDRELGSLGHEAARFGVSMTFQAVDSIHGCREEALRGRWDLLVIGDGQRTLLDDARDLVWEWMPDPRRPLIKMISPGVEGVPELRSPVDFHAHPVRPSRHGSAGGNLGSLITGMRSPGEDALALFERGIDTIPIPIYFKDLQGRYVWCNDAYEHIIMGRPLSMFAGLRVHDIPQLLPTAFLDYVSSRNTESIGGNGPQQYPLTVICADGRFHLFHVSRALLTNREGEATGVVGVFSDLTELHRAESVLREKSELLAGIIEHIPHFVFWKDRFSVYGGCNANFAKAAGVASPAEIVGKSDFELSWSRHEAEVYRARDRAVMDAREPLLNVDETQMRADGKNTIISTSKVPLRNHCGDIIGVLGIFTDVTEERQARAVIARLAAAIDKTAEAIVITNAGGDIEYVNAAFEAITGYTRQEALGQNPRILRSGLHDDRHYAEFYRTITAGETWRGRFRNRRKDGSLYDQETSVTPLRDEAGAITSFVAVTRDVTETVAAEAQQIQAQKLESIGQLAAGIAHEINTPAQFTGDNLRFLMSAFERIAPRLEAAIAGDDPGQAVEASTDTGLEEYTYLKQEIPLAIQQALEGVSRIDKIVRAMKEFSHPGASEKTPTDINRAIENTVTVCRNHWKYVAEMKLDLDPAMPLVPCLPGEFNQVILNLVVNAADAIAETGAGSDGEQGLITLSTRVLQGFAEVRVADSGVGIPHAIRDRIFDHFFTTKVVGKGSGQGLAIAHAVIEKKHGGTIRFESEVGKGTTFIIRLPLERSAEQATAAAGIRT